MLTALLRSVIVMLTVIQMLTEEAVMHVPHIVKSEFTSLEVEADPIKNLRSLAAVRDWAQEAEIALIDMAQRGESTTSPSTPGAQLQGGQSFQEIGEALERPRQAVHRSVAATKSEGLAYPEYDGVSSSTLRYWLRWWSDPVRTPEGFEEAGRDPARERRKLRKELEARAAAGLLRKPITEDR